MREGATVELDAVEEGPSMATSIVSGWGERGSTRMTESCGNERVCGLRGVERRRDLGRRQGGEEEATLLLLAS